MFTELPFFKTNEIVLTSCGPAGLVDILEEIEKLGGAICGGFARHSTTPKEQDPPLYSDIDVWPKDHLSGVFLDHFLKSIILDTQLLSWTNYENRPVTSYYLGKDPIYKVQLIEQYGQPFDLISGFDISVTKIFLNVRKRIGLAHRDFIEDIPKKQFRYLKKIPYSDDDASLKAVIRMIKYMEKGFKIEMNNLFRIYPSIADDQKYMFLESVLSIEEEMLTEKEKNKLLSLQTLTF